MKTKPRLRGVHLRPNGKVILPSRNSQKKPIARDHEYSKLWGLKKLKIIIRGVPKAGVLPYKVYPTDKAFHAKEMMGASRLLVRTDEKGREYRELIWADMPRTDLHPKEMSERQLIDELDSTQNRIKRYSQVGKRRPKSDANRSARFIIHPTKSRSHVQLIGKIRLRYQNNRAIVTVTFDYPDPSSYLFRPVNIGFSYVWDGRDLIRYSASEKLVDKFGKTIPIETAMEVVKKGLLEKQLKFKRLHETELSFNTWADDPSFIEFFDLKELRYKPR